MQEAIYALKFQFQYGLIKASLITMRVDALNDFNSNMV